MCKRGDIYFVDFGDNIGRSSKQSGIRPAIIISNNLANAHSPVITVVPLTSRIKKKRSLPTHVFLPRQCGTGLYLHSLALCEQVDAIDKIKLLDYKGSVNDPGIMKAITHAVQIQIGAVDS